MSNPTGFEMKEFVRASTSAQWRSRDPWAKNEAWRYSGPFTRWNRFRRALPGFGIAVVAFSGYLVVEQLFLKDSQGHGEAQEEGHH